MIPHHPHGNPLLATHSPWYKKALTAARSPRAPKRLPESANERAARVYLVDLSWRDPEDCALVVTTAQATFVDLLTSLQLWVMEGDTGAYPAWASVTVPRAGATIRKDVWGARLPDHWVEHSREGVDGCVKCSPLACAFVCVECAAGVCGWHAEELGGLRDLSALVAAEEGGADTFTRCGAGVSGMERVHTVPFGRSLLWNPENRGPDGMIRPLAVLSAEEAAHAARVGVCAVEGSGVKFLV